MTIMSLSGAAKKNKIRNKTETATVKKTFNRMKDPRPSPCVYLTASIPSIRDTRTAAKAIIPHLTLIKVIIVFFSFKASNPQNQTNRKNNKNGAMCRIKTHMEEDFLYFFPIT